MTNGTVIAMEVAKKTTEHDQCQNSYSATYPHYRCNSGADLAFSSAGSFPILVKKLSLSSRYGGWIWKETWYSL
jgi:hypothetical protein